MRARVLHLALVVLALLPCGRVLADAPNRIPWAPFEAATVARAQREGKPLLLVVSTSWCHWCHVMQRETYADPRVEAALARFVVAKEDADARPDLAERFRKHRWPATAFFAPDGREVLALRGYRSADELLPILADVERRVRAGGPYTGFGTPPSPPAPRGEPDRAFLEGLRARLRAQLDAQYDTAQHGWGKPQKYPLAEPVLWGLRRGLTHAADAQPLRRAMDTLAASEALLDPVFGGMFQYSVGPTWRDPHYEKIMGVNAGALEAYSRAFALSGNERWKRDAETVKRWFERFLTAPDGAFYASQDAEVGGREATAYHRLDERGRLAIGVPRVDTNVYARENGQAIRAYVAWALATGDEAALERAARAAKRVVGTHLDPTTSLLRHDAGGRGGRFFLLDQAEMGLALVALHQAGSGAAWTREIRDLAKALVTWFAASEGGWFDVAEVGAASPARTRSLETHAQGARCLLAASIVLDDPELRAQAVRGIAAMSDPAWLDDHWRYVGGLLLAVEEALAGARVLTLHATAVPEEQLRPWLRPIRGAQRRSPDLWLRWAYDPGQADLSAPSAPFATICEPDGTCSDPITSPFALEQALAPPLLGGK